MHDEGLDAGGRQASQAVQEAQLRAYPSLGTVVHVAGEEQELGLTLERELHQVVPRLQRGLLERRGHRRRRPRDALEGRVQVQVGSMDEAERTGHSSPFLVSA